MQHLETGVDHDAGRTVVEAHRVGIDPESRLAVILRSSGSIAEGEAPELTVNSSHHQVGECAG